VDSILGLLGMALFILSILALSAAVTWTVVRLTPRRRDDETPSAS